MTQPAFAGTRRERRRAAVFGTERTCPRCGAQRAVEQRYCLDCGLPLLPATGGLPALRRTWLRLVGWYPGDFVWTAMLTLVLAAAATAAAVVVSRHRAAQEPRHYSLATAAIPRRTPAAVPPARLRSHGGKLPRAARPDRRDGRLSWPRLANGWTVVIVSYPKASGRRSALLESTRAAKARLAQVGIIDSSRFASLQPGYFVVFAGIYGSRSDADAAVATVRGAGFPGAYSRQIAR